MSVFWLKIIAYATMIIDHVGLFFFPDILIFRIIGRLSFPIFAWLAANGAKHTRNRFKYSGRILAAAFLTQPFYYLANRQIGNSDIHLNIFFTLFLGLLAIFAVEKFKFAVLKIVPVLIVVILAIIAKVDYGAMGVLSIVFFSIFYKNKLFAFISQFLIFGIWYLWLFLGLLYSNQMSFEKLSYLIQPIAVFSMIFIFLHNNKEGRKMKWLFYAIYPIQYVVFYVILAYLKD